jgi:hypothetical protein
MVISQQERGANGTDPCLWLNGGNYVGIQPQIQKNTQAIKLKEAIGTILVQMEM